MEQVTKVEPGRIPIPSRSISSHKTARTVSNNITLNKLPGIKRPGIYSPNSAKTLGVSTDPTLTWDEVADASGYDVFVGTNVLEPLQKVGDNVPSPNFPVVDFNFYFHLLTVLKGNTEKE